MSEVENTEVMPSEVSTEVAAPNSEAAESPSQDITNVEVKGPSDLKSKLEKIHEGVKAKQQEAGKANQPDGGPAPAAPKKSIQERIQEHALAKHEPEAPAKEGLEVNPGETPAEAPAPYTPNLKLKFLGEEKEIPEILHSVIKDPESEKQVRELVEKSLGLDYIKPKFQSLQQEHTNLTKGLSQLDQFISRDPATGKVKDLGKFIQSFGLTQEDVFNYAKDELEYQTLPEDQRARIDAERQREQMLEQIQQENATLQNQQLEFVAQQKDMQLRQVMSHPQVAPVIAQHPGGQAAFYRDVAQFALIHEMQTGQDLTPEQAVVSYIQSRGLGVMAAQHASVQPAQPSAQQATLAQPAPGQVPAQPAVAAQPQERAPTLPKVPSQGTSPARKMVGSMKDIIKRRNELMAQQD